MKRTKPYVADATGRSTGAMLMTAVVTSVLFTPMNAPATITATITTSGCPGKIPIAARSTVISTKLT